MQRVDGVWSSEATGLHYSSMENETLLLRPDGSGWLRFARPGYTDHTDLTWCHARPGQIAFTYHSRRETTAGETRDTATDSLPGLVSYQIAEEDTPLAGRVTLLRLKPALMLAHEFGLRTHNTDCP